MRVLMVTPSYYPIKGGAETIIRNFSIELNRMGVETDVLTFNMKHKWKTYWQAKTEKIDGINIFRIPALNWLPITHSNRITLGINLIPARFKHHFKKYDIIHFHGEDLTLPLFSCTVKKPKIFHSHGFSLDFYKKYFLSRLILKNIADIYIAISKRMQRNLCELGIPRNRIRLLYNAINVETFYPSEEKIDNLVLFVGRIVHIKGLHILLESLRYLKSEIHLVIIGPPGPNKEYYTEMLRRVENENKKGVHKIIYLGEQEHASIVKWYQKASFLVLPSLVEAFAIVNLEALACGTPVIATSVGGIPEVIQNGKTGILVPPNNSIKLAEAIQYLLDNKDIRTKLGQEGRKHVCENFSMRNATNRLRKIYEEILAWKA